MSAEPTQLITAAESRAAEQERKSLLATFADKYGLEPKTMMATLKATAFKGDVTNEQMAALLIVAHQHNLNPWCKEIYAFPSRQGIVPIVGVDGWARIINEHPQFDGMDFEQDDEKCTCRMYRKDRSHPIAVTEYAAECKRPTDPWTTHPKRMLRHKTMIQAARLAFSFAGIYDPDEGERVLAAEDAIDVTPEVETSFGPAKISAVKMRTICEGAIEAAKNGDAVALYAVWGPLSNAEIELVWKQLRSYERTAIKKLQGSNAYKIAESGLDVAAWGETAMQQAKDPESVDKTYAILEEIYAEHDEEVPLHLQSARTDRKAELGAQ
jgi:phage recombination protein Bet